MYNVTVDKQYKNRRHIRHFNKTVNITAAGNLNVHELLYLICVILMFGFCLFLPTIDVSASSALEHFSGLK